MRNTATCTCPNCNSRFSVLEDEQGDHHCPKCGYHSGQEDEEEDY